MKSYKISYELDGGVSSNPVSYTENDEIVLKAPLRCGYKFVGWKDASPIIEKGSRGDRCYTALWEECDGNVNEIVLDTKYFGKDDGLKSPESPIVFDAPIKGTRGEDIYTVKTVYTDIKIDGVKDPAYDYGLHISSAFYNDEEYYKDKQTRFDAYIIRGQDGMAYVFAEIVDPNVIDPDELWRKKPWRCDSLHFFYDYYNTGRGLNYFLLSASGRERCLHSKNYKVVMTDVGYNVEFAFNNRGVPFVEGDSLGYAIYLNDCAEYESLENHKKFSVCAPSALIKDGYKIQSPETSDALVFSIASATGKVKMYDDASTEPSGDVLKDIISGAREAAIVCHKDASAYTVESSRRMLSHLSSFCPSLKFEDGRSNKKYPVEILVGLPDREESRELAEKIPYNGYAIEIKKDKICVIGWLEEALDKALGLLASAFAYVKDGGSTDELCGLYCGVIDGVPGEKVPHMDELSMVTDAGGGAYLVLSQNSSEAAYRSYLDKLVNAGYSIYTENVMHKTLCTTLHDDDTVINLTYGGDGDPNLRAVVESKAITTLPALTVEPYEKVSASKIIQVAPNFMCYLIKLDNGEFIAVDSGNNTKESYIYEQLMKHSDDGKPVIAAWFFSHFHQDHIGGFIDFAANEEYMKNVTIKSIVSNFPEKQVILTAKTSWRDMDNVALWPERVARTGADVIRARTGQKFRFGNVEIEHIYTYEDLMPFFVYNDRSNPTSSVISVKIEGQRLIITGDCCGEATRLMVRKYGEALKTDFVQLPHHGWGDGGTAIEFYELADAPWVLYPGDAYAPSKSEDFACKHAKRYFLREFTTLAIPLPYNGEEPEKC